jgi:hypothetical protein
MKEDEDLRDLTSEHDEDPESLAGEEVPDEEEDDGVLGTGAEHPDA